MWPCLTYFASCHDPCVAFCSSGWPCFASFASWHAWPSVAAAWPYFPHFLLCFLSWPLCGLPWPPRGLASPTLLPVMAPAWHSVFTYFASCRVALLCLLCFLSCVAFRDRRVAVLCSLSTLLPVLAPAWPSMAAAWPCFAYFASCHPCMAFRGRSVALRCPLCLLSWPPRVALLRLISLLPVLAPVWASVAVAWSDFAAAWTYFACCLGPCVAFCGPACPCFAYFASCHGPCVAFRGRRVALLCSRCFLSWPLRGLPWPPRGLTLLTLLPVLAPAWPSVAAAWPYFAHVASCLGPFRGRRLALLCSLCPSGVAF